ncbi:hypothetical protein O6H91_04G049000 [Diphasiastrum complanatum]|uniref:Uncharacterized protein n=1 Tax=Diphasiastrum complanatum TaxID=34168 RepID=A0ACC2DXA0_DIPCM|nr:hypothetical protein O6H91_Y285800 [Diphasiastrum complanatum]KAJ7558632.1 hypothetical protein O6H91_04G049000 [Diphasiastrum complanatum]
MEAEQGKKGSTEGSVMLRKPMASRPQLTLPPRPSPEALLRTSDMFPSPMPLTPSFMSELDAEGKPFSFSSLLAGAMNSPSAQLGGADEKPGRSEIASHTVAETQSVFGGDRSRELGSAGVMPSTARFKATPPSRLPIPKSSYVTIPPGLSPTTLLDSPVLFATHQSEPSPTTGSFPLPPFIHGSGQRTSSSLDSSKAKSSEQSGTSNFVFKPAAKPGSQTSFPPLAGLASFGVSHQQALAQVQVQARAQVQIHAQSQAQAKVSSTTGILPSVSMTSTTSAMSVIPLTEPARVVPIQSRPPDYAQKLQLASPESNLLEEKAQLRAVAAAPTHTGKPSHDGYNWRKYGQKQVKGSENPRSYYKCTHANCPMKKIVEQSFDGQITEIIYRGEHNHPKPQATRRTAATAANNNILNGRDGASSGLNKTGGSKVSGAHGSGAHGSGFTEGDLSSKMQEQTRALANGMSEALSPSTSNDEASSKYSGDDDDPDGKRRKKDKSPKDALLVPRTIREPRVVVQTTSDVDILDDGYRWRKYGQKVVKGNPHPRSYYKCTNLGCPVRKHVERAPTDPNAVITTYEGKHNHDVPVARGSSHDSMGTGAAAGTQTPVDMSSTLSLSTASLQGQGPSFANVNLMAPKTEDTLGARTLSSIQYGNTGERSSLDFKVREAGGTGVSSSSAGVNNASAGAENFLGSMIPFSQPTAGTTTSMQLKQEQGDEYMTGNSMTHQSKNPSFHDASGTRILL